MLKENPLLKILLFLAVIVFSSKTSLSQNLPNTIQIPPKLTKDYNLIEIPNEKYAFIKDKGCEKINFPPIEASAVELIEGENYLLVAHDDIPELIISTLDAKTVRCLKIPNITSNLKWESMTKDKAGFYYVMGAHQHFFLRFRLLNSQNKTQIEIKTEEDVNNIKIEVKRFDFPAFKEFDDLYYQIEGLSINEVNNSKRLVVGFRDRSNKSKDIQTYYADLTKDKINFKLFFTFKVGFINDYPFHLSSIEHFPNLGGFLILTSTELPDNEQLPHPSSQKIFFGNRLWFVGDDQLIKIPTEVVLQPLGEIFEPDQKAEGVCFISNNNKETRLAIVFDNDSKDVSRLNFYNLTKPEY